MLLVTFFLVLNSAYGKRILAGYLVRFVKDRFNLTMKVGSLDYGWSPLSVRLMDVSILGTEGEPFFSARSVSATIPYSSFRREPFVVQTVVLESPFFDVDHLPRFATSGSGKAGFRLEQVQIQSGKVIVSDYNFHNINGRGLVDPVISSVSELSVEYGTARIALRGTVTEFKHYKFQYQADGNVSQLSQLSSELPKMQGPFHTSGSLEGEGADLVVTGEANSDSLIVEDASPFSLKSQYKIDTKQEITPYVVKADWKSLPWNLLQKFSPEIPSMGTSVNGSLEYSGGADPMKGTGTLEAILEKDSSGKPPLSGKVRARFQNGSLQFDPSILSIRSSRANFSGIVTSSDLRLNVNAASAALSDLAFLSPNLRRIPGAYQFNGTLSGPFNRIQAKGKVVGSSADLRVDASGSFITGIEVMDITFTGSAGTRSVQKMVSPDIEGSIQFSGKASGSIHRPKLQAEVSSSELKVKEIDLGDATATLASDGVVLDASASFPGISSTAEATYRFSSSSYELTAQIDNSSIEPLQSFLPPAAKEFSGNITAELIASGNLEHWKKSTATLSIQDAQLNSKELEVKILPESRFELDNGTLNVDARAESTQGTLRIEGTTSISEPHQMDLHATGETNASVISLYDPQITASGPILVDAFIRGTFSKPDLSGSIRSDSLEASYPPKNVTFKQGKIVAEFSGTKAALQGSGLLNDSEVSLDGTIPFSREKGEFHLDIRSFPIESLAPGSKISGTITVKADFEGLGFPYEDLSDGISRNSPIWDWNGKLSVTPENLMIGSNVVTTKQPLTFNLQNGVLEVDTWEMSSGELLDLAARGNVHFDSGAIDASLRVSVKVDLLSSLQADIQSDGPMSLYVNLGGTLMKPEYSGSLTIKDASLHLPNYQFAIEHLNLYAPFDSDRLRIETLTAQSGGGTISGGGEIYLGGNDPTRNIWLKGAGVGFAYPVGLRSQLDYTLNLALVKQELLLSGDVRVLRSAYSENFGLKNRLLLTLLNKRKELFQQQYLKSSVRLAVKIRTVDDFRLKNNLGEIRAFANVQVNGTLSQPKVSGRIRIQSGSRVYFLGRRYDVESGTIDFYGTTKLQPTLNITLNTLVQDYSGNTFYEITLPIVGPLNKLEYQNPQSVPSLSDDQIYSLLLTGSTAGAQAATSPSLLFQRELVAFLSGQLLFGAEEKFAQTFGLSRIDVQQNLLATGDSAGAKLIVGKDIGNSFSLTYSFPLSDPNQQTWIVSYRYRRDFIFRAIRQDDDSYTASARHNVLFGKGVSYGGMSRRRERRTQEPRIDNLKIENNSPIPTMELQKKIKQSVGDLYDYWEFQDNVEEVEKFLQEKGYLYPSVLVQEEDHEENNTITLTVKISSGPLRTMSFVGTKIKGKQMDQYKKWWREGISENLVLRLIRDNLQRELWLRGYHQATVDQTTSEQNGVTDYRFEVSSGVKFIHAQIEFTGNSYITSEHLLQDIILFYDSKEQMISEAIHDFKAFKQKVEAAYIQQGLLQSKPESGPLSIEEAARKIVKQVSIEEGPFSRIAKIVLSGIPEFPPDLQQRLRVKPGDIVDLELLPVNEDLIREYYESAGYRNLSLDSSLSREEGTPNIILTYDLKLGKISRIASIEIEGNNVTRSSLIEKRLQLKVGEILTDQKIAEAQRRLYDLGIFQQVRVQTEETNQPEEVDLLVHVVEGKKYELQYGPRYNSDSGVGAEVNLVDHNLFGSAHRGSFYGRYDANQPLYRFDYFIPSTGFWSNTLLSLFYSIQDEKIDEVFEGQPVRFTLETKTSALQFQQDRRFKGAFRVLYGFEFGNSDIRSLEFVPEIPDFNGSFLTFSSSLYMDTRNDPLNAKRGMFFSIEAEYAPSIGTDVRYVRNFDQFFYYKKLGPIVWASGVRAGFLKSYSDEFTLNERFQTGGGNSVRGFRNDALTPQNDLFDVVFGGNAVFVLNQEIRFPIYKWLGAAVFYDGGNVYPLVEDFDPWNIRNTGGLGLRIDSPYIVLRFDVGFNFDPLEGEPRTVFHFGIGQAF